MKHDNCIFEFTNEQHEGKTVGSKLEKGPYWFPLTLFGSLDIEKLEKQSKEGIFSESDMYEIDIPNPTDKNGKKTLDYVKNRMLDFYFTPKPSAVSSDSSDSPDLFQQSENELVPSDS